MLSDMTMRKIDISSDQRYFNLLLHEMTSASDVSEAVSAERLRRVMARLQKKSEQISPHNAAAAASAPREVIAAIGHGHGGEEDEQPGGVDCGAGAPAACASQ